MGFNGKVINLLRRAVNCQTKLKHVTIQCHYDGFYTKLYQLNDTMGKEITQLLTQITTNTSIKSLFIDPLWLKPEYNQFLRMWYSDPFGNCNIPKVLDLNGRQIPGLYRKNKVMNTTHKFVYVANISADERQC